MAEDGKSPNSERASTRRRPGKRPPFSEAIARAEFGRFYWGEEDEEELHEARSRKRKHQSEKNRKGGR